MSSWLELVSAFPYNDLDVSSAKQFWAYVLFEHLKYLEHIKHCDCLSRLHSGVSLSLRSFTLDSESEVYVKNFRQRKPALSYKYSRAAQSFTWWMIIRWNCCEKPVNAARWTLCDVWYLSKLRCFVFWFNLQFSVNMQFNLKKATTKLSGSLWILMKLLKMTKNVQLLYRQMSIQL